jgi:hypothetical protein
MAVSNEVYQELAEASRLPAGHFDLFRRQPNPVTAKAPYFDAWISLARLAAIRSLIYLEIGSADLAHQELSIIFRLAEAIRSIPTTKAQMVRQALLRFALNVIWEGLAAGSWTEKELAALDQELEQVAILEPLETGLLGNALGMCFALDQLMEEHQTNSRASSVNLFHRDWPGSVLHNKSNYVSTKVDVRKGDWVWAYKVP